MHILLTRPETDLEPAKSELEACGHRVSTAPMLKIRFLKQVTDQLAGTVAPAQALAVTSQNGVRALIAAARDCDLLPAVLQLPVYAVGSSTAKLAKENGFTKVSHAGGNVRALAQHIQQYGDPKAGPIVHASGLDVAGDLGDLLSAAGFAITPLALYKAEQVQQLPRQTVNDLKGRQVDAVMFFSPRTAEAFVRLIATLELEETIRPLDAYCLSNAVAEPLKKIAWHRVHVAAAPRRASLIDCVRYRD